jgi:hypothetical protein
MLLGRFRGWFVTVVLQEFCFLPPGGQVHGSVGPASSVIAEPRAVKKLLITDSGERGLFMDPKNKGRFYHDGRFQTLLDVVNHYNDFFKLGLSAQEKSDLVEYLKSLFSNGSAIVESYPLPCQSSIALAPGVFRR